MAGSLDDFDVKVIDGREVLLMLVVYPDGLAQAGFNGISKRAAADVVRGLADAWEREAAAEN